MPSPTNALEIIKVAMRHLGLIATGETMSAAEAADGLAALNDVIETWNTEGLAVYAGLTQSFITTPGVGTYTIGPTGAIVATRPVNIMGLYTSYQGVDYPASEWTYLQYQSVGLKTTGGTFPERYCYVNNFPNGQLFLWPVPAVAVTLNINAQLALPGPATLATALSLPPGYMRALAWDLAAEIAPQYGMQLTELQIAQVRSTKAAVKKANRVPSVSGIDAAITGGPWPTWQRGY